MKTFCEVVVSDILPAFRALVTKELINNYGMTQMAVAEKMKVSQPSISYYLRELRGVNVKKLGSDESVMNLVKETAANIANGTGKPVDMRTLCRRIRDCKMLPGELDCCNIC